MLLKHFRQDIVDEVVTADCYGLRSMLPPPDYVLDGGACFGAFTLLAHERGAKLVEAFEPDPVAYEMLVENVANAGGIQLHRKALGLEPVDKPARRHLVQLEIGHSYFGPHEGVDVETCVLPAPPDWARSACLKLDVEGAERELFAPVNLATIKQYRYVVMEWHHSDGALYASILDLLGFAVDLIGGAEAPWDPSMTGGILRARREW